MSLRACAKASLTLAVCLGASSLPRPALAQEAPHVAMAGEIASYYGGEATSAYVVIGLGAACVGAGIPLVAQNADFARGLGIPLLGLGALEGIGAVLYAFQVHAETQHFQGLLGTDADGFRKEELAHIAGTSSRFVFYRAIELGLAVAGAGVATYGFAANRDLYKGLGIGLFAIGAPFLLIDTINNGRATRYHQALLRFDPSVAVQADHRDWRLSLGGRF